MRFDKHLRLQAMLAAMMTALGLLLIPASTALRKCFPEEVLLCENQETGEIYAQVPIRTGDRVEFRWIHSFEHIPWNEYYRVQEDRTFLLETISVAGFGAGIPAEMDVDYRYEDGLVYMDNIGSVFDRFNFFSSDTALQSIQVNAKEWIRGSDMPYHAKVTVYVGEK